MFSGLLKVVKEKTQWKTNEFDLGLLLWRSAEFWLSFLLLLFFLFREEPALGQFLYVFS